ncbi:MAG TPA: gamma-glutamyl-gamma-aminobutyrate hydrolase family protein [Candidatus Limnocylindria bacterium]|jgi:putative glutamine amidotransferase|nr:gamma-glutamyl-gamma-aminobutyrate hydrolase family protein [Candidatus Limnocylindria bacterium]
MSRSTRPLILVTPSTETDGIELSDHSISVATRYLQALIDAGALPLVLPVTDDTTVIADAVTQADGILLTGGDDIDPHLHWPEVPEELLATCECAEPIRDRCELAVIREVLLQKKPLMAICRGHQLFNVALGGNLYVDLPTQRPGSVKHPQLDRRFERVHEASILPDTQLARVMGLERVEINSTHHQAINRLADPLRVSLVAPDGVTEGTELKPEYSALLPWFASVQYHPERLYQRWPEHHRLFQAFVEACAQLRNRD